MENIELQNLIVQNLLLGLKKQSEAYLDLISNTEYTHEQRKDFEKELSDINKVLNELSGKTINYTVSELEALKIQFNDRLTQLNSIITNLEINTLKIEFDSLTPEQKAFLKGEKGDKGEKGENSYELAVRYGFVGNEIEYLNSLKGKDGVNGVNGINGTNGENGLSAYELAVNNGFTGTLNEWLLSLKGADGQDAESAIFDFDTLDTIQKEKISNYILEMVDISSILSRIEALESNTNVNEEPNNNEQPSIISLSIDRQDNIETEFGTRFLTDFIPQENDKIGFEVNINGEMLSVIYKAVSVSDKISFQPIIQDNISNANYSISVAPNVSTDGRLVIYSSVNELPSYSFYGGLYNLTVAVILGNERETSINILEYTESVEQYFSWLGWEL